MRWRSWRRFGDSRIASSSGCPIRMIWISFDVSVSRFESRRTCSSVSGARFCASSMRSSTRRPSAFFASRKRFSCSISSRRPSPSVASPSSALIAWSSSSGRELRIEDERDLGAGLDALEQRAAERRLAGADLAGDRDEALAVLDAVEQVGERLAVRVGEEEVSGVGREREGLLAQAVELGVHPGLPLAATRRIAKSITRRGAPRGRRRAEGWRRTASARRASAWTSARRSRRSLFGTPRAALEFRLEPAARARLGRRARRRAEAGARRGHRRRRAPSSRGASAASAVAVNEFAAWGAGAKALLERQRRRARRPLPARLRRHRDVGDARRRDGGAARRRHGARRRHDRRPRRAAARHAQLRRARRARRAGRPPPRRPARLGHLPAPARSRSPGDLTAANFGKARRASASRARRRPPTSRTR